MVSRPGGELEGKVLEAAQRAEAACRAGSSAEAAPALGRLDEREVDGGRSEAPSARGTEESDDDLRPAAEGGRDVQATSAGRHAVSASRHEITSGGRHPASASGHGLESGRAPRTRAVMGGRRPVDSACPDSLEASELPRRAPRCHRLLHHHVDAVPARVASLSTRIRRTSLQRFDS